MIEKWLSHPGKGSDWDFFFRPKFLRPRPYALTSDSLTLAMAVTESFFLDQNFWDQDLMHWQVTLSPWEWQWLRLFFETKTLCIEKYLSHPGKGSDWDFFLDQNFWDQDVMHWQVTLSPWEWQWLRLFFETKTLCIEKYLSHPGNGSDDPHYPEDGGEEDHRCLSPCHLFIHHNHSHYSRHPSCHHCHLPSIHHLNKILITGPSQCWERTRPRVRPPCSLPIPPELFEILSLLLFVLCNIALIMNSYRDYGGEKSDQIRLLDKGRGLSLHRCVQRAGN